MSTLDSIKTQIHNTCGGTQLTDDTNHFIRRMFRCWLDGSYNGEQSYKTHCEFVKLNHQSHKRMRAFVINQFCRYIARDFHCSTGHAQKCLVACMTTDQLNTLNDALIEDAKDLVADYIEEQTKECIACKEKAFSEEAECCLCCGSGMTLWDVEE